MSAIASLRAQLAAHTSQVEPDLERCEVDAKARYYAATVAEPAEVPRLRAEWHEAKERVQDSLVRRTELERLLAVAESDAVDAKRIAAIPSARKAAADYVAAAGLWADHCAGMQRCIADAEHAIERLRVARHAGVQPDMPIGELIPAVNSMMRPQPDAFRRVMIAVDHAESLLGEILK